jgi:acetyl esterase/lipase
MPPDYPYPAAMDDAIAVGKAALQMQKPENMAIFGTSTGGGTTLAMILHAKAEGPAAAGRYCPRHALVGPDRDWRYLQNQ